MKNLKLKKTWPLIGLFLIYMLFYLCLRQTTPKEPVIPHFDKLIHFSAYFLLSLYFHQIFKDKHSSKLIIFLTLIGVVIEFLQEISGYRTFEYLDMIANSAGAITASIVTLSYKPEILSRIESLLFRKSS